MHFPRRCLLAGHVYVLLLLVACGTPQTGSTGNGQQTTIPDPSGTSIAATSTAPTGATSTASTTPAGSDLEDTAWHLIASGLVDKPTTVLTGTTITATFEAGGKLNGSAGCNSYFATY